MTSEGSKWKLCVWWWEVVYEMMSEDLLQTQESKAILHHKQTWMLLYKQMSMLLTHREVLLRDNSSLSWKHDDNQDVHCKERREASCGTTRLVFIPQVLRRKVQGRRDRRQHFVRQRFPLIAVWYFNVAIDCDRKEIYDQSHDCVTTIGCLLIFVLRSPRKNAPWEGNKLSLAQKYCALDCLCKFWLTHTSMMLLCKEKLGCVNFSSHTLPRVTLRGLRPID